jgi:hypothetical protein
MLWRVLIRRAGAAGCWWLLLGVSCAVDERSPRVETSAIRPMMAAAPEMTAAPEPSGEASGCSGAGCEMPGGNAQLDAAASLTECEPGTRICSTSGLPIPVLCSQAGGWQDQPPCAEGTPVCLRGECVACAPNAQRCSSTLNNTLELCSDAGDWVPQSACPPEAPACFEGACLPCAPGTRTCADNAPQTCLPDGSGWTPGAACTGATPACLTATGSCGSCSQGQRQCNADTPQVCNDAGQWQNEPSCAGDMPQCLPASGQCVACDPAEGTGRSCAAGASRSCDASGNWQVAQACSGDTPMCIASTGLCGCAPGSRCLDNRPQTCVDGNWVSRLDCADDFPVCSGGECTCTEGTFICNGDGLSRCNGRYYDFVRDCNSQTSFCDAARGRCTCSDDSDPATTLVQDERFGCGFSRNNPDGAWTKFDTGMHIDGRTGKGWYDMGFLGSLDLIAQCQELDVFGITNFRAATVDDYREIIDGCPDNEVGGVCGLTDQGCLAMSCTASCSATCSLNRPHPDGFCRANLPEEVCTSGTTGSRCPDCPGDFWTFNRINADFNGVNFDFFYGGFCISESP